MPSKTRRQRKVEKKRYQSDDDESDEDLYSVERIVDKKIEADGTVKYFIKWDGYPDSQNTWEPLENLANVRDMVKKFDEQYGSNSGNIDDGKKSLRSSTRHESLSLSSSLGNDNNKFSQQENIDEKEMLIDYTKPPTATKKRKTTANATSNGKQINMIENMMDELTIKNNNNNINLTEKKSPIKDRAEKLIEDNNNSNVKSNENLIPEISKRKSEDNNIIATNNNPSNNNTNNTQKDNNLNKSNNKKKLLPPEGHFKFKDKPKQILSVKAKKDGALRFKVSWHKRPDGTIPKDSAFTGEEFRAYDPIFLLDFYESKIVLCTKKSNNEAEKSDDSDNHNNLNANNGNENENKGGEDSSNNNSKSGQAASVENIMDVENIEKEKGNEKSIDENSKSNNTLITSAIGGGASVTNQPTAIPEQNELITTLVN